MLSTSQRFTDVFRNAESLPLDEDSKYILFSDCHRGENDWVDDFAPNQNLLFYALTHYFEKGYTYIEVGDGEELWKNRSFERVRQAYSHIYWLMGKFHEQKRLYLLWGNHNMDWQDPKAVKANLYWYFDDR